MEIETVIFDIDDTLIPTADIEKECINAAYPHIKDHSDMTEETYREIMREIKERNRTTRYRYLEEHFVTFVKENIKLSDGSDRILAMEMLVAYSDKQTSLLSQIDPNVSEFLKYLQSKRFILIIVSSGIDSYQYEKLVRTKLARFFYTYLISDSPDKVPSISKAITDSESDPTKTVYIGDRPDRDIDGAKKAGILAFRLLQGRYKSQPNNLPPDREFGSINELFAFFKSDISSPLRE